MAEQTSSNPYIFDDPEQDRLRLETQTRLISNYLIRHIRGFAGDNVRAILDLGCGSGQLGFRMLEVYPGAQLIGIDRNPVAIQNAAMTASQHKLNASFSSGDIQVELPPGSFDLALASLVLLHTQRPDMALKRVYERLSSGGTLCVIELRQLPSVNDDQNYDRINGLLFTTLGRIGSHPNIVEELPGLVAGAGFVDYQRRESESDHPLFTHNENDMRYAFAAGVGAMYNARQGIAAATGTPLAEVERMIVGVMNTMSRTTDFKVPPIFAVATARKP